MITREKKYTTAIDLAPEVREQMIQILNEQMATMFDLYSQTKQAHWNVKGMNFIALHELFDELAAGVEEYVDMMAERVTALGGYAAGTARMAAGATLLPEWPVDLEESGEAFVRELIARYAQMAAVARAAIDTSDEAGDMATSDLFTEIVRGLDKNLYFLEAHIQGI